jgi:putative addiction module component (TIGR02574 family)
MTRTELQQEALQLPVEERLQLAEALWESVEDAPVQPQIPEWQRAILAERIAEDDADPDSGRVWQRRS